MCGREQISLHKLVNRSLYTKSVTNSSTYDLCWLLLLFAHSLAKYLLMEQISLHKLVNRSPYTNSVTNNFRTKLHTRASPTYLPTHLHTHQPTYPLTILPWIIVGYRIPGYPSYEGHTSIDPDFEYRITSMIDDEENRSARWFSHRWYLKFNLNPS
jgi:hypothetical protein